MELYLIEKRIETDHKRFPGNDFSYHWVETSYLDARRSIINKTWLEPATLFERRVPLPVINSVSATNESHDPICIGIFKGVRENVAGMPETIWFAIYKIKIQHEKNN